MKIKKILLVHLGDEPGGIEVLLPLIMSELKNYRFESFVCHRNKFSLNSVYNENNVVHWGANNLIGACFKFFKFLLFHRNEYSVINTFNCGPIYLFLMRLLGIKCIVYSIHGTVYWNNNFKKYFIKTLWKLALNRNVRLIANSIYSAKVFKNKISSKFEPHIIYNPIEIGINSINRDYPNSPLKFCYAGRLTKSKNLFRWIDVADKIAESFENSVFNIYGRGILENELKDYANKKMNNKKIIFRGYTNNIRQAYLENDLLIFFSEFESFGNVVVESILCGTPVIASNIPSMKEIFENFPEFLVELNDDLEANIINKIKNYKLLVEKTKAAAEEFKIRFSKENHLNKLNEIYSSYIQ